MCIKIYTHLDTSFSVTLCVLTISFEQPGFVCDETAQLQARLTDGRSFRTIMGYWHSGLRKEQTFGFWSTERLIYGYTTWQPTIQFNVYLYLLLAKNAPFIRPLQNSTAIRKS